MRTMEDAPISDRTWDSLDPPLSKCCLDEIKRLGFEFMTPVQCATIPHFMRNKDVAVEAVTGSGKTLAFVLPIIEILTRRPQSWSVGETGAIIVTPTRELAVQIAGVLDPFMSRVSLQLVMLIGGRDLKKDIVNINSRGAQVVVATPGRLVDVLCHQECILGSSVHSVEVLVLDEADRLLELGFEQSISTILSYLPKQRRTGLFSATLNQDVKALMRAGMRNPITITVRDKLRTSESAPTPKSLSSYFLVCEPEEKMLKLFMLLDHLHEEKVIVFFATCSSVAYFSKLAKSLLPRVNVLALHGKMHSRRHKLFAQFSDCSEAVLMCTDVMARGVDFPCVDWVIQFDPPSSTKSYVHRCGRTARMGQLGKALVVLLPWETSYVEFLDLNQHITLEPYEMKGVVEDGDLVSRARELNAKQREFFELAKKAFVSFVHFYYKHECKLIFQAKALDLVGLAKGYALPHLPKMPEFRGLDTSSFEPHPLSPREIKYSNKMREKQRQLKLEHLDRGVISKRRQLKEALIREKAKKKKVNSKKKKKKHSSCLSEVDLEELATEARLLRKFKAGKITKEQLEEQLDDD